MIVVFYNIATIVIRRLYDLLYDFQMAALTKVHEDVRS